MVASRIELLILPLSTRTEKGTLVERSQSEDTCGLRQFLTTEQLAKLALRFLIVADKANRPALTPIALTMSFLGVLQEVSSLVFSKVDAAFDCARPTERKLFVLIGKIG